MKVTFSEPERFVLHPYVIPASTGMTTRGLPYKICSQSPCRTRSCL